LVALVQSQALAAVQRVQSVRRDHDGSVGQRYPLSASLACLL